MASWSAPSVKVNIARAATALTRDLGAYPLRLTSRIDARNMHPKRMKLLYVSQYFPPEPGAPAARVSELAAAWVAAGHDVTVLTGMPNHPTGIVPAEYRGKALVEEDFRGVRVVRTWVYAAPNKGILRRSAAYAAFGLSASIFGQLHVARPDVLVATSPQFLCAVAGHAISLVRRCPFVFEVRDLWPESVVAVGALSARHPIILGLELLERHLYEHANHIVVVTDSFKEKLSQRGVDPQKISVIKNGADLSRFAPRSKQNALRARLAYGDRFVVAYVGTLGMAHGLGSVLDLAARLQNNDQVRFLFVGDGAERNALEARVESDALTHVTFLGAVPRDDINEVYAACDVCLVPLRKAELFQSVIPSKIFEIMAMERPMILSVDGEARRIVEQSHSGLYVPPEDVDGMTAAVEKLIAEPDLAQRMGESGRRFVIENFDRNELAARYLDILRALV